MALCLYQGQRNGGEGARDALAPPPFLTFTRGCFQRQSGHQTKSHTAHTATCTCMQGYRWPHELTCEHSPSCVWSQWQGPFHRHRTGTSLQEGGPQTCWATSGHHHLHSSPSPGTGVGRWRVIGWRDGSRRWRSGGKEKWSIEEWGEWRVMRTMCDSHLLSIHSQHTLSLSFSSILPSVIHLYLPYFNIPPHPLFSPPPSLPGLSLTRFSLSWKE